MNYENWQAWSGQLSRQVVAITAQGWHGNLFTRADANAVLKLAEERLRSDRGGTK